MPKGAKQKQVQFGHQAFVPKRFRIAPKLDLDFGIPDPYPKDGTGMFADVDNTQMFGKMCYLNTLHKCLTRCIF